MSQEKISLFYVTCPDLSSAERIGRLAVEKRLAACANTFPHMTSIYRWNDQIEQASEAVLILKSRAELATALQAFVCAEHPYETPCFLEIPISSGAPDYLQWLLSNTLPR